MKCHTDCIERPLKRCFNALGEKVSKYSPVFVLIPILVTIGLGIGLKDLKTTTDVEYLYTPTNGPSKSARNVLEEYFPVNYSGSFQDTRTLTLDGTVTVLITARDGGNILRNELYQKVIDFQQSILTFRTERNTTFYDVCALWESECVHSPLPHPAQNLTLLEMSLTYPTWRGYYIPRIFGGVQKQANNTIYGAKALKMSFYLRLGTSSERDRSAQWMKDFLSNISSTRQETLDVNYMTSDSLEEELNGITDRVVPLFSITYSIIISFAITSCVMMDPVLSKPMLGLMGVVSVAMAILTTFGLLTYAGVEYMTMVANMPFLILGIGVDDMFIMLSAWRQTKSSDSLAKRTGLAMEEAGPSITITSFTNAMAFGIGLITPFPAVRIFCTFCLTAIVITFLYQITFFAAWMSIFGKREIANRHAWTCMKLKRRNSDDSLTVRQLFCTGGSHPGENSDRSSPLLMIFFREHFGPFLMRPGVKAACLILYCGYIAVAVWGCTMLHEGLEIKNLAPDNSYLASYHELDDQYFRSQVGLPIMVAFTDAMNFSDHSLKQIETVVKQFEEDPLFLPQGTDSWLRSLNIYTNATNRVNCSTCVDNVFDFLAISNFSRYQYDVIIRRTEPSILYSRVIVLSKPLLSADDQKNMMLRSRKIATDAATSVTVFHPAFVYFDQYAAVLNNTLQNIGMAGACMLLIALLLIPNPICALWVALTIVSIDGGVVGLMTLWGVNLDLISMINIILCIGFSVDFSAHITYGFVSSKEDTKNDRAIASLYKLGMPILQGSLSTILAIIVLSTADNYIFRTFFKTMFLVMVLGTLHGLVVLPVLLSLVGPGRGYSSHAESTTGHKSVIGIGEKRRLSPADNKGYLAANKHAV